MSKEHVPDEKGLTKGEELAAQLWTDPRVSDRQMDVEFAQVIGEALDQLLRRNDHAIAVIDKLARRIAELEMNDE